MEGAQIVHVSVMPTTSIVVTVVVLCLLMACEGQFDFDFGVPKDKAAIEPVDTLVFVGETLKLRCSLTDTNVQVTPESMYFKMTTTNKSWIVPQENITVANESIYADVKITDDYSNMTTVACWSNILNESLKSVMICAEKPIKNITDFSGVYLYFYGSLELTWSLGESYLSVANINVSIDWNANYPPHERGNKCDKQTRESCRIPISGQDIIFVRITVEYIANNARPSREFLEPLYDMNATSVIQVVVSDHIQTEPPINLRERDINSTCAELTWDEPLYFKSCQCPPIYMVNVTEKGNRSNTYMTKPRFRPEGQNYISVCNLSPYTSYKLSVQLKAEQIHPWSELADIEVTTDEDSPLTGPPLTSTSYHVEECVENITDVTVYWNDQLKSSLQGELTKFEVHVGNDIALLRKGSNYFKSKLNCDTEHRILVYSATKAGKSMSPSNISIRSKSAELPEVSDVRVRMEETQASSVTGKSVNVTVTWDAGRLAGRNVTLVLYMCQSASVPYTCFNDFRTVEISVDNNKMLLEDLETYDFEFGYALKDDQGGKRGIQWIDCVYRAEQVPKSPPPVSINVGKAPNTLEISWTSRRCDKKSKVLILWYHLFICKQKINQLTDLQSCFNTTVNSSVSTYIAKDLPGGTTYYVYIKAESPAGLGRPSEPTLGVPDVGNSNPEQLLDVVMGTLSAMIFASIVVICFARQCVRSQKKVTSYSEKKYNIFENEKQKQPHANGNCSVDKAASRTPNLEMSLEKPHVPPALIPKSTVDLIPQTLSHPTNPLDNNNKVAHDTKDDNTKDTIPSFATHIDAREPQVTCALDVSDVGQSVDLPGKDHKFFHSDSANPYVKMTNECFSSGSYNPALAVDEGYNSPEVEIDSPEFSGGASQTLLTDLSAVPPLCINGVVPIFSPQSQDVFPCMAFSHIPTLAEKLLLESGLSLISPQSEISNAGLSINSPQSQISETNLSTILSIASLYPHSHQSLIKHTETKLSLKPMVTTNNSVIHVYHVNSSSPHPKQSLPLLHELPQAVNFDNSNSLAATSLDSNLSTVSFQNNKNSPEFNAYYIPGTNLPARPQIESCNKQKEISADSTEVCDITGNSSGLSRGDNSNQQLLSGYVTCAIDGVMNLKALNADSQHGSTNSENLSSPNCETSQNPDTPDGSQCTSAGYKSLEFFENTPELDSSGQCRFGNVGADSIDQGRFGTAEEDSVDQGKFGTAEEDSVHQSRFGTHITDYVCQGRFETLAVDSSDKGRFGTVEEDSVDQGRFGTHITDYAGQDRTVTYKRNFNHQNRLAHVVNNNDVANADVDNYATCAINSEVNFEKGDSHLEDEPVASLNRCSDYTPSCRTHVHTEDAFSDNESDNYISKSICSEVGLTCTAVANKDDSQDTCEGYRGLHFLENFHGNQEKFGTENDDCIQHAGCGIQEEGLGHQGELEMHNNFVNEGRLSIEKNNDDDVDVAQTFDCIRPNVTHKNSNPGVKFSLKPEKGGNNIWEMLEVSPEQTASADSSFEQNDLDNDPADATIDHFISEGGYVAQVQLSTPVQSSDSHC